MYGLVIVVIVFIVWVVQLVLMDFCLWFCVGVECICLFIDVF